MKFERRFALLFLLPCLTVMAEPAPWFKWRSKASRLTICKQTSPGEFWVKVPTPYRDAHCTKPKP